MIMTRTAVNPLRVLLLIWTLLAPANIRAQRQRQLPPPDESAYGSNFFDQLRTIFGRFRDADLQRVFSAAGAIECSELVGGTGEWREVAFFNEDRKLGDWCYENIDEVKADLSVFIFKGECKGERGSVLVSTEFPIGASMDAYNKREIDLDQVDVNLNAPVSAALDPRTLAYTFELPYLFRTGRQGSINIYSFMAPNRGAAYAIEVTSRWECKSVTSADVTYRFLICRAETVARNPAARGRNRNQSAGASAFFILSDGKEAQTRVNLTFGGVAPPAATSPQKAPPADPAAHAPATDSGKAKVAGSWQPPGGGLRLADAGIDGIRLRFNAQTWSGKIGSAQLLSDHKMSSLQSTKPQEGMDYCVWRPEDVNLAERLLKDPASGDVSCSLDAHDRSGREAASLVFDLKTGAGSRPGTLQCFFPRSEFAASITFDCWVSVVGYHIMLEVRQ